MSGFQDQLDEIANRLEQIDQAIRGNGQPGIKIRLDRLERSAVIQSRLAWLIIGAGVAVAVSDVAAFVMR
ncbi:MAG: hypothetical protein IT446_06550 [Phycisphaerales bacterium]|nr:hypothetical protein [Phycisphaerales bacterium]